MSPSDNYCLKPTLIIISIASLGAGKDYQDRIFEVAIVESLVPLGQTNKKRLQLQYLIIIT